MSYLELAGKVKQLFIYQTLNTLNSVIIIAELNMSLPEKFQSMQCKARLRTSGNRIVSDRQPEQTHAALGTKIT